MTTDTNIRDLIKTVSSSLKKAKVGVGLSSLKDGSEINEVPYWISSGCMPLDIVMTGGYPGGRMVELYGANSSGKSLLGAQFCAQIQRAGGIAVYADAEGTCDESFFQSLGVDTDNLIYYIPRTIEQVYIPLIELLQRKIAMYGAEVPIGFVWDSVASTATLSELEKPKNGIEDRGYPDHARIISQNLRRNSKLFQESNITSLYINQSKRKLGAQDWAEPNTFGGEAIKFYASMRIELDTYSKIRDNNNKRKVLGVVMRVTNKKNKVGPPFRQVEIPIYFGYGTYEPGALLSMLKALKLYTNSGANYDVKFLDGSNISFKRKDVPAIINEYYVPLYELIENAYFIPEPGTVASEQDEVEENE